MGVFVLALGVFNLLSSQRLLEGAKSAKHQAMKGLACAEYVWNGNTFIFFHLSDWKVPDLSFSLGRHCLFRQVCDHA